MEALSKLETEEAPRPLFVLDLKRDPARTDSSSKVLRLLQEKEVPGLVFREDQEVAVLLGEDEERRWFLQIRGGTTGASGGGKVRETLLFLAGECAGLLFFRELSTLRPSSASTP